MISIGKLVKKSDGPVSIAEIISTICKYGREVRHVVNDILSPNEQAFYSGKQHRYVPGGREITPGQIYVTNQGEIRYDMITDHNSDILLVILTKHYGFVIDRISNSHFQLNHPDGRRVTIPRHNRIKLGVIKFITVQLKTRHEEFLKHF